MAKKEQLQTEQNEITTQEQINTIQAQMNEIAADEAKREEFFELKAERNRLLALLAE